MIRNYEECFLNQKKKWVFCPTKECKNRGYLYIENILKKWISPSYLFHFKKGGHVAAVKTHQNNKYFCKIDLKDFFPNIKKNKVQRILKKVGFSFNKSKEMAEWSTVASKQNKHLRNLPYGFVQSQIIASLCLDFSSLGTYLKKISSNDTLTVYVDDIIISGNNKTHLKSIYLKSLEKLVESGFTLNETKSHPPQINTCAFNINIKQNEIYITKDRINKFTEKIRENNEPATKAILNYISSISIKQKQNIEQII